MFCRSLQEMDPLEANHPIDSHKLVAGSKEGFVHVRSCSFNSYFANRPLYQEQC